MCLFCKMVSKEIQAKVLFEDDEILAFHDLHPARRRGDWDLQRRFQGRDQQRSAGGAERLSPASARARRPAYGVASRLSWSFWFSGLLPRSASEPLRVL